MPPNGLESFEPQSETVKLPNGGEFAVRGLALEDFSVLIRKHHDPINALFEKYVAEAAAHAIDQQTTGGKMNLADIQGVVLEALEEAPPLIGDVIARASGLSEENAFRARLLPLGVQIDTIEKIVRLTLEAEGGLEKFAERISQLGSSLTGIAANASH